MSTAWIIDDDKSIRWVLEKALAEEQVSSLSFEKGDVALMQMQRSNDKPDVIISDVRMPGMDGFELLQNLQQTEPDIPVIIMTAHSDLDSAVTSYQQGAFEYLPKPFDVDEAVSLIKRAIQKKRESAKAPEVAAETSRLPEIIGEAPAMQEVFRAIGRLSKSNITVLINGQSGTGKELVARALHKHSIRKDKPFVALNMAAIPKELIESELFGHEKGAFTGASQSREGRFEQANGGTLFLDEIGDMPLDTQTRLLRVLADGEFYRVGGRVPVKVDVRIIAATHQNLEDLVTRGDFREDLFHRLNVIRVHLPKLRERREDIPALAKHFLARAATEIGVEPKNLSQEAAQFLMQQPWPGNVRQLENTCRWLTVMGSSNQIMLDDMPPELMASAEEVHDVDWTEPLRQWADEALRLGSRGILREAEKHFELTLIDIALQHTGGRKKDASELLGWGRNTLTRKLKEYDHPAAKTEDHD